MANSFEQEIKVLSSRTDDRCRLGVLGTLNLLQDNMCEYFDSIECDGLHLVPSHNCFFVVSKTRVHFDKYFKWLDKVGLRTIDDGGSRVAVNLRTTFENENGDMYIDCMQEMCVMDCDTRKLRLVNTTPYPLDTSSKREKCFSKLPSLSDDDFVGCERIKYTNIDFYHHTNNVEYMRIILDNMGTDFNEDVMISDVEIHYLSETRLGDNLDIYRKVDGKDIYFELRLKGVAITRAKITLAGL